MPTRKRNPIGFVGFIHPSSPHTMRVKMIHEKVPFFVFFLFFGAWSKKKNINQGPPKNTLPKQTWKKTLKKLAIQRIKGIYMVFQQPFHFFLKSRDLSLVTSSHQGTFPSIFAQAFPIGIPGTSFLTHAKKKTI